MFKDNKNFYPTPPMLAAKMWAKIPHKVLQSARILEPSAGEGALIGDRKRVSAIEQDPRLVAILQSKGVKVIDRDFLTYSGRDNFDVIIANPPFDNGEKHLLKAIEIMYEGHIVFLLNAETLKNPHTALRKVLAAKLEALGASIEYIEGAFSQADRRTDVETALVHIEITPTKTGDIAEGLTSTQETEAGPVEGGKEVASKNSIPELVADFNNKADIGTKTIVDFYEFRHHVGDLVRLEVDWEGARYGDSVATYSLKEDINKFLGALRRKYWGRALDLDIFKSRMTSAKLKEFEQVLVQNSLMDFTVSNVRQLVLNILGDYEETLTAATVDLFDRMTKRHSFDEGEHNKTVHLFNGWKTNKAWFVNPKVILPFGWSKPFVDDWNGKWKLDWSIEGELNDIDKVMNYFDGRAEYVSIVDALKAAFAEGESTAESTYFKLKAHKKGTLHLTFNSEDIRRRFNVTACRGKDWLPQDYGTKKYSQLTQAERRTVNSFEGMRSYIENIQAPGKTLFVTPSNLIQIEDTQEREAC